MWTKLLLAGLELLVVGLIVFVFVERARSDQETEQLEEAVVAASTPLPTRVVRADDYATLPAPVQRYFSHVLRDGQPYVKSVRIEQSGTFRGDRTADWRPFRATQHVSVRPPGFVWDASIRMLPMIPVRVLDAYHTGRGMLQARVGGVVPVMDAEPSPELDEGELLRYLAEAPLYPTALLPGMGVTWTAIDDRSARATLTDQGTTAALLFYFNEKSEVARVTGRRPFLKDDGSYESRPWVGHWRNYEERNGMRVPTDGAVAWIHPDGGEGSYWRGRMERVVYQMDQQRNRPTPSKPPRSRASGRQ